MYATPNIHQWTCSHYLTLLLSPNQSTDADDFHFNLWFLESQTHTWNQRRPSFSHLAIQLKTQDVYKFVIYLRMAYTWQQRPTGVTSSQRGGVPSILILVGHSILWRTCLLSLPHCCSAQLFQTLGAITIYFFIMVFRLLNLRDAETEDRPGPSIEEIRKHTRVRGERQWRRVNRKMKRTVLSLLLIKRNGCMASSDLSYGRTVNLG